MKSKTLSILIGTIAFSFLFFHQSAGINLLLFTILILALLFVNDRRSFGSFRMKIMGFLALLSGVCVAVYGSSIAIWANAITLILLAATNANERSSLISNILHTVYSSVGSIVFMILQIIDLFNKVNGKRFIRILAVIIPLIFIILFFIIYRNMNPLFEKYTIPITLDFLSIEWLFFTIVGFILVYSFFNPQRFKEIDIWETNLSADISKENNKLPKWSYQTAFTILFATLNLMLLVINILDVNYLYLGSGMPDGINHKQFVHNGVDMLILSIVLGISLMLFFFRGYLNFTNNNLRVKLFAKLWIIQNLFMVISTCIRNTMYIDQALLSYKRIGVYYWLAFAVVGLITTFLKIHRAKTSWYLIRTNFVIIFILFVASATVDWDRIISSFNIGRMTVETIAPFDKNYLLSLSETNIAQLFSIRDKEGFEVDSAYSYRPDKYAGNQRWLDQKVYDFLENNLHTDWRSFSLRKNRVLKEILALNANRQILSFDLSYNENNSLQALYILNNLERLDLQHTMTNSQNNLVEINQLRSLKELNLSNNYIKSMDTLSPNENLNNLDLSFNQIEDLQFLSKFKNLDTLNLNSNQIINLSSLPYITKLQVLSLDACPVINLEQLSNAPKLKNLSLNRLSQSLGYIPRLCSLEELSLRNSKNAIASFQGILNKFPSLITVDLSSNGIDTLGWIFAVDSTTKLTTLILSDNKLFSLSGISHLTSLQSLNADNNNIKDASGINELTDLRKLNLSDNYLSNLQFLEALSELEVLNLKNNMYLKVFDELIHLENLRKLDLSETLFTNLSLINGEELTLLILRGCRIKDWQPLASFRKLEILMVSSYKENDIKYLKELRQLKKLLVYNTENKVIVALAKQLPNVEIIAR